jgi:hypothetical protein
VLSKRDLEIVLGNEAGLDQAFADLLTQLYLPVLRLGGAEGDRF